jgi:pimeloyl-ACP methyl ester carboxylesterase
MAPSQMQPFSFGGHFGWLHSHEGVHCGVGVVLVSGIGRDQRCAHMPMRVFADELAQAGFSVLRYDHLSTGDSLEYEPFSEDVTAVWLRGITEAVAQLKAATGVKRVILGGVRLGATLAAQCGAVADGLMLFAPVLSGRSWLRRLRFSANVARAGADDVASDVAVDTDGIYLSAASARGLEALDLQTLPDVPIFIAAQNQMGTEFAEGLKASGLDVTDTGFDEFRDLFLDAHSNKVPHRVFARALDWLQSGFPLRTEDGIKPIAVYSLTEATVRFGAGLWGVFNQPQTPSPKAPAVLFLNTGGDPRAGIGGFATKAARALAQAGIASLRFDLAGLGDSAFPGPGRSHVYETPRHEDMQAALGVLAARGHEHVIVVGICAGAYHALHASFVEPRIVGVVGVSPVKLLWKTGDTQDFARKAQAKSLKVYQNALLKPDTWLRLVQGKLDIPTLSRNIMAQINSRLQGLVFAARARKLYTQIEDLAHRGVHVRFVAGLDDSSLDEMESLFGAGCAKLKKLARMQAHFLPDLDHGLARQQSRDIVFEHLVQAITELSATAIKPAETERTAQPYSRQKAISLTVTSFSLTFGHLCEKLFCSEF